MFNIWVGSNKWLLRYSTFNILRSSSIGGRLHLKYLNTLLWSPKSISLRFIFEYNPISGFWDIPLLIFWGRLPLEVIFSLKIYKNMVWSSKLKFKIWVWSIKWLLRYSTSSILRSGSIKGRLHLKHWLRFLWSPYLTNGC